jgi:hypothetical protein
MKLLTGIVAIALNQAKTPSQCISECWFNAGFELTGNMFLGFDFRRIMVSFESDERDYPLVFFQIHCNPDIR